MSMLLSRFIICGEARRLPIYAKTFSVKLSTDPPTNSERKAATPYDIVIAGGGLVGTTLACSISKNKMLSRKSILLLEGAPKFNGFQCNEYSNRVSALNRSTVQLLKDIGAWEMISAARYKPVKQMRVWDASSDALITFNHDNFSDDVAYIIENDLVLDAVYKELEKCKNVEVRNMSRVECIKLPTDGVSKSIVALKEGEQFTCEILVGADGANSLVRQQMCVNNLTTQYNQMGLVATLELCEADDNSVAWQRFLPTGPVALLPLNDTMSSLVWSTSPSHAKELKDMSPEEFCDALNEAFLKVYPKDGFVTNTLRMIDSFLSPRTKAIRQFPPRVKNVLENSRACFPLGFGHASSYVAPGVALIGDAAHRIHPLAGQGVNLGFGDVKCLTNVLAEASYSGYKLGDKHHLLKYERERLLKNVPIMVGVHGLQCLYSTTFSPVVLLRSLGLQITQNAPPLKKIFMERAMG